MPKISDFQHNKVNSESPDLDCTLTKSLDMESNISSAYKLFKKCTQERNSEGNSQDGWQMPVC